MTNDTLTTRYRHDVDGRDDFSVLTRLFFFTGMLGWRFGIG